jgi:hypothetical protein
MRNDQANDISRHTIYVDQDPRGRPVLGLPLSDRPPEIDSTCSKADLEVESKVLFPAARPVSSKSRLSKLTDIGSRSPARSSKESVSRGAAKDEL